MSEEIKEQTEILREILRWTKISNLDKVRNILLGELNDENKTLVYFLSDGKSSDEIEKIMNKKVTDMSIRNWWKKWGKLGIMEIHPNYKKRFMKIFDVEDYGIKIPKFSIANKLEQENNSPTQEEDENVQIN